MYIVPANFTVISIILHPPQILTQFPALLLKDDDKDDDDIYKEEFYEVDEVILCTCLS